MLLLLLLGSRAPSCRDPLVLPWRACALGLGAGGPVGAPPPRFSIVRRPGMSRLRARLLCRSCACGTSERAVR